MAIAKKTSFILIFASLFAILLLSTSCVFLPDGGSAMYDYSGETYAELCERISRLECKDKLFDFSLISLNFDDDSYVTESEYAISGVYFFNMVGGKTTGYLYADSKSFICLNDPNVLETEVLIEFTCDCQSADTFPISQDSIMELVYTDTKSENDSEFVYSYSLVVDGEDYATVEFSCTEELSEEALDELCERVLNNIVIVN